MPTDLFQHWAGHPRAKLVDGKFYKVASDGSLRPMKDTTDWKRVNALTDEEIEAAVASDPDAAPIADEAWFAKARRAHLNKEQISIKLDTDVLAFFRKDGPRLQTQYFAAGVSRRLKAASPASASASKARASRNASASAASTSSARSARGCPAQCCNRSVGVARLEPVGSGCRILKRRATP